MPNFVQTQQYESSSESDDTMDQQNVQEKKRVKRNFDWTRDKCFFNDTEAQIAIKREEQWSSFAQFKDLQFGIWKVTLPNIGSEWKKGFCNCPNFLKEYICKHVIGMAIRLKHCKPPSTAKDVPLGEKESEDDHEKQRKLC